MTPEQISAARKLRARDYSYRQIAIELGQSLTASIVRNALHPGLRPARIRYVGMTNHKVSRRYNRPPPQEVLQAAETDAVNRMAMTPSQLLLGDPPPGRSALDKMLRKRGFV